MSLIHPILFVDLLKQTSYKNKILLGVIHKQLTYFSKKYSKDNRITPEKYLLKKLPKICKKNNIKVIKCTKYKIFSLKSIKKNNIKMVKYNSNNKYYIECNITQIILKDNLHYCEWYSLLLFEGEYDFFKITKLLLLFDIDKNKNDNNKRTKILLNIKW